jgi:DNA polymerase-3 subunit beta
VQSASKAIARGPKPVLQNVRIGDGLVTGTNLEIRIDYAIGEMCEPFLVPAARLVDILQNCFGETVKIKAAGGTVTVKCQPGEWVLPTEDVDEFPVWEPDGLHYLPGIPEDQFKKAVHFVLQCVDTQSSRYALGGVLIESSKEEVTLIATDGRRLARSVCVHDGDNDIFERDPKAVGAKKAPIVPKNVMENVRDACQEKGENLVAAAVNDSVIRFEVGGITVTANLVAGRFPEWRDLVRFPALKPAHVYRKSFAACMKASKIVTTEQSKGVTIAPKDDCLLINAQSSDLGHSKVECAASQVGEMKQTKLDPSFVLDFLSHVPSDMPEVHVFCESSTEKVLFGCDRDDSSGEYAYTGVIMPLAEDA